MKVGHVEGECPRCGKKLSRPRPCDVAVCDCWKYCPNDHGNGAYATLMEPYTPDLSPQTYGPIEGTNVSGDSEHPMKIMRKCPVCGYYSAQLPIEVQLS